MCDIGPPGINRIIANEIVIDANNVINNWMVLSIRYLFMGYHCVYFLYIFGWRNTGYDFFSPVDLAHSTCEHSSSFSGTISFEFVAFGRLVSSHLLPATEQKKTRCTLSLTRTDTRKSRSYRALAVRPTSVRGEPRVDDLRLNSGIHPVNDCPIRCVDPSTVELI